MCVYACGRLPRSMNTHTHTHTPVFQRGQSLHSQMWWGEEWPVNQFSRRTELGGASGPDEKLNSVARKQSCSNHSVSTMKWEKEKWIAAAQWKMTCFGNSELGQRTCTYDLFVTSAANDLGVTSVWVIAQKSENIKQVKTERAGKQTSITWNSDEKSKKNKHLTNMYMIKFILFSVRSVDHFCRPYEFDWSKIWSGKSWPWTQGQCLMWNKIFNKKKTQQSLLITMWVAS